MQNQTIAIRPIDKAKLDAHVTKGIGDGKTYEVGFKWALVDGTDLVITDECVGFKLKEGCWTFDVYQRSKSSFAMFPSYTVKFTAKQFAKFAGDPVDLKTFMGDRWEYNGRIQSNTDAIMAYISSYKAKAVKS